MKDIIKSQFVVVNNCITKDIDDSIFIDDKDISDLSKYYFKLTISNELSKEYIDRIYKVAPIYVNIDISDNGYNLYNKNSKILLTYNCNNPLPNQIKELLDLMKEINKGVE